MTQDKIEQKVSVKSIIANIAIMCISIVVALLVAEGLLRFKNSSMKNYDIEMWKYSKRLKNKSENPVLGHEHRKPSSSILQSVEIRINDMGLRGGPVPAPKKGRRRILLLGSSITLGWGVPEDKTMTVRLENMLKDDGADAEVLNAGIGNYNTVRYVERFLTKLTDLKPTDIVVHYFINDAEALKPGGGNFILRSSQLAAIFWSYAKTLTANVKSGGLEGHYKSVYAKDAEGYIAMKSALKRLSDYANKNDIRIYLAMMPDIHNLTDYPFKYIHDDLKSISKEYGYTYIDIFPGFEGLTPEEVWSMPGDPHPNELGHEIIAKAFYPVFESNKNKKGD
jgi:lysophospholipase L1-like esterase